MNRLHRRGWFRKTWAPIAVVGLGLALQACSNPCGDYEHAMYTCGQSFNRSKCDQNIGKCTSDDVRTIESSAQCAENPSVCTNNMIANGGKYAACILPVASISQNCLSAFF